MRDVLLARFVEKAARAKARRRSAALILARAGPLPSEDGAS
jgi:hypothetical protein